MTELWRLPATELAQLVRTRKVSAREASEAALQRLDAVNPKINAVVAHRPDLVLQQADRIDQMVARGEDPGVLAGVPVTVKVNIDQAGFATTNGTLLRKGPDRENQQPCRRQSGTRRRGAARPQQRTDLCVALVHEQSGPWAHR